MFWRGGVWPKNQVIRLWPQFISGNFFKGYITDCIKFYSPGGSTSLCGDLSFPSPSSFVLCFNLPVL